MKKKSYIGLGVIAGLFLLLAAQTVFSQDDSERPIVSFDASGRRVVTPDPQRTYDGKVIKPRILSEASYRRYPIQPNSVLHISLKGDERSLEDPGLRFKVSTNGTIKYPYIGEVDVIHMTEEDLARKLELLLEKDYVRAPQVKVTVTEELGYWLLGDLTSPGRYTMPMDREITLREGIMLCGGFREDSGGMTLFRDDWTNIKVTRTEFGQRQLFEFKLLEIPESFTIKPDDIILCKYGVNMELGSYYILGEVLNPGKYPIVSDDYSGKKMFNRWGGWSGGNEYPTILGASNVVDAVFGAQELTENAARNWVYLVRKENGKTRRYRIPMGHIYYKGNVDKYNMKLKDGDVITVSESWF